MRRPKGRSHVGFLLVAVAVAWAFGAVYFYVSLVAGDEGPTVELTHSVVSAVILPAGMPLTSTGAAVPPPLPAASKGCPSPYWRPQPDVDAGFSIPYATFGPRKKASLVCDTRLLWGRLVAGAAGSRGVSVCSLAATLLDTIFYLSPLSPCTLVFWISNAVQSFPCTH